MNQNRLDRTLKELVVGMTDDETLELARILDGWADQLKKRIRSKQEAFEPVFLQLELPQLQPSLTWN